MRKVRWLVSERKMIGDKDSRASQIPGHAGLCTARKLNFVLSVMEVAVGF